MSYARFRPRDTWSGTDDERMEWYGGDAGGYGRSIDPWGRLIERRCDGVERVIYPAWHETSKRMPEPVNPDELWEAFFGDDNNDTTGGTIEA